MAYSLFTLPHIRAGFHHIFATFIFSLYGMQVSSYLSDIHFVTLFFQTAVLFFLLYLVRLSLYLSCYRMSALSSMALYTVVGMMFAAWHHHFYNFPLETNIKVAFGIIVLGSFISVDLAISDTRVQLEKPDAFNNPPQTFVPLALQVGFAMVYLLLALTMLLSMVMNRELAWLVRNDRLFLTFADINQMVQSFFIAALIMSAYVVLLTKNAASLFKRQISYQIQTLNYVGEQNYQAKVPMNMLGEFGIIAYYTNCMLQDLGRQTEPAITSQGIDTAVKNFAFMLVKREGGNRAKLLRIQRYVRELAEQLGKLDKYKKAINKEVVERLYQCAPLYDIGKIAISEVILQKEGPLSAQEKEIFKTHAQIGADILNIEDDEQGFFELAREMALSHHENWDGSGYPFGLSGAAIPLSGKIVGLANYYDELRCGRHLEQALSHAQACEFILENSGKLFDPDLVQAFGACEQQFADIVKHYDDKLLYTLIDKPTVTSRSRMHKKREKAHST
ncbi:MAG: HD-GYP domain-containing protein [Vibrionaceae bacterium]